MAITNKDLYNKICDLCDIYSTRMAKENWINYDCSWIKRCDEPNKDDVIIIVVRGSLIKRTEKAIRHICSIDEWLK